MPCCKLVCDARRSNERKNTHFPFRAVARMFQNYLVDLEHLHVETQLLDKVFSWIILTFSLRCEPVVVCQEKFSVGFKILMP
jgi:hypothetical protein